MSNTLLETPLHDWHAARGGKLVDFAGWDMPVQYTSIGEEHHAVRNVAGLFDISHMGRLWFRGPDACAFLDRLLTNDVTKIKEGQIRYSLVTNELGGILDDVLIYRWPEAYSLVVNASNREKIVAWIEQQDDGSSIGFSDRTFELGMIAIQGPRALEWVTPLLPADPAQHKYYSGVPIDLGGEAYLSRTGYTGEDGCEIIASPAAIKSVWETLLKQHESEGLLPCGLGCRDTLRLEAAMPLYGHELSEEIDPLTAGLGFGVKLDAGEFIGKAALVALSQQSNLKRRVGIEIEGRRIAREGTPIYQGDQLVGEVTSGTQSPTLEKSIAMAYVEASASEPGTALEVDFRGKRLPAQVVPLPFYKR